MFLARNLGYPIPVWNGIVRYWPVLLIAWGLFKLVDFFGLEAGRQAHSLFSGGDIAAIVLVILFGSLITLSANLSPHLGKFFQTGELDLWDLTGNNFPFTEQHMVNAAPDSTIEIANRYGDVEVVPGDDDRITVDVRKTVRGRDQAEAEKLSSGFEYSITHDGPSYRIGANFDNRFKASLTVHVPHRSIVSIDNRSGKVSVRGLTGTQEIANRFGDVEVRGITGKVKVQNQNGDVNVSDVSDSVVISNSFAPVTVSNIRGELKISGRNCSVSIEHVEKNVDVESAYQNIDIRDPRGTVNVKNRNGEIVIRLLQKPMRDVSISSEYGDVNVDIPGGSAFSADVHSRYGEVHSDFTELRMTTENSDHSLTGQVGSGGPVIRVDGRNGEIRFRKRG